MRTKCENLGKGVSSLEEKCNSLSVTVDNLNIQLERSVKGEAEMQNKVSDLTRTLTHSSSSQHDTQNRVAQLERSLAAVEQEKKNLEEKLEDSRQSVADIRRKRDALESQLLEATASLQKSESKANQLELSLQTSKSNLENSSQDKYLRDELGRLRKENDGLQERVREMTRKVQSLEDIKRSNDRKRHSSLSRSPGLYEQVDHVRSQIPLMGSGGGSAADLLTPTRPHRHPGSNEYLVKIRILEQENERHLRKIRSLEEQLSELESLHGSRVQDLLQERRKEREKETHRQKETIRQIEMSQLAREKIFKERIKGLEQQVELLKDQLSKELRRRQVLITESRGIGNEISELRQNLDQSLQNVYTATDGKTLDREAGRLNLSVDRYGPDITSRLTPSKLSVSVDNLSNGAARPVFSPGDRLRRTLHFDDDDLNRNFS